MEMRFFLLSMLVVLFAGCDKDDDSTTEPEEEPGTVTYSVTYSVNKISDDFFTFGSFIVTYADKDGKEQVVELKKASQLPLSITVEGLDEDGKIYFDLTYGSYIDVELTKETYTFAREVSYSVKGSNGATGSASLVNNSLTVGKNKVEAYVKKMVDEDTTLDTTIKDLMKKE